MNTLRVSIVGRGRAGRALGVALSARGVRVRVVGRRLDVAAIAKADVVFVAVPDDRIREVAARIAKSAPPSPRAVVLHLAGALGPEALAPLARRVRAVGVLHPLQSLVDPARGARSLRGALFGIDGGAVARGMASRLAKLVGGVPFRLPARRALYHASSTLAAAGAAEVLRRAEDAMVRSGVSRSLARRGLARLVEGVVENSRAMGPGAAKTGPGVRGDRGTLRRHRATLRRLSPGAADLYALVVGAR